jgi:hypothetical protein
MDDQNPLALTSSFNSARSTNFTYATGAIGSASHTCLRAPGCNVPRNDFDFMLKRKFAESREAFVNGFCVWRGSAHRCDMFLSCNNIECCGRDR